MRHTFSDGDLLKAKAKEGLESGMARIRRWWSKKYNLPPNHELLENQTMGEVLMEMYEDSMVEREELKRDLARETGDQGAIRARISAINEFLDDGEVIAEQDDLIDKWERELLEGKTPDLDEGV